MGLYFNQHEQLHHALETLPVRGATKSHKFKLLPLFVWTVLRHDYSKTVTATTRGWGGEGMGYSIVTQVETHCMI